MKDLTIRFAIPVVHVRPGWPGAWDAFTAAVRRRPQVGTTVPVDLWLELRCEGTADCVQIVSARVVPSGEV